MPRSCIAPRRRRCPVCRKLIPLSVVYSDYFWREHVETCNRTALAAGKPCVHPPERLHSWYAADTTLCVACNDCGAVLTGGVK